MTRNRASFSSDGSGAGAAPLSLIHRNNCSNPMSMRVTAVSEDPNGLPLKALVSPCPLSFLMGWRAANGAKSKTE